MPWKTTATLIALSPFATLWLAFTLMETFRALAIARICRRR